MRWQVVVIALAGCGRLQFDQRVDAGGDGDVAVDADATPNFMFVTSTTVTIPSLGGIAGADMVCNQRAVAGGLPGTYVAWLSTPTMTAPQRLGSARGWVRPDGLPFADTVTDIVNGKIFYPPRIDELHDDLIFMMGPVLTGTTADGMLDSNGSCSDYTGVGPGVRSGTLANGTATWTDSGTNACGQGFQLYCFGIDHAVKVAPPAPVGRRAFLSRPFMLSSGRGAADAICSSDATTNSLGGTFVSLLPLSNEPAATRLPTGPWTRLDGVNVTADLAAWAAPLAVRANGTYAAATVWAGANTPMSFGTAGNTCQDWMSNSNTQSASLGDSSSSRTYFFTSTTQTCDATFSVYCFEQ